MTRLCPVGAAMDKDAIAFTDLCAVSCDLISLWKMPQSAMINSYLI